MERNPIECADTFVVAFGSHSGAGTPKESAIYILIPTHPDI